MEKTAKRGRRLGVPTEGTKRLHAEIVALFDCLHRKKQEEAPLESRHLDRSFYAEQVKEALNLTYTIQHILRIVNNSRRTR